MQKLLVVSFDLERLPETLFTLNSGSFSIETSPFPVLLCYSGQVFADTTETMVDKRVWNYSVTHSSLTSFTHGPWTESHVTRSSRRCRTSFSSTGPVHNRQSIVVRNGRGSLTPLTFQLRTRYPSNSRSLFHPRRLFQRHARVDASAITRHWSTWLCNRFLRSLLRNCRVWTTPRVRRAIFLPRCHRTRQIDVESCNFEFVPWIFDEPALFPASVHRCLVFTFLRDETATTFFIWHTGERVFQRFENWFLDFYSHWRNG